MLQYNIARIDILDCIEDTQTLDARVNNAAVGTDRISDICVAIAKIVAGLSAMGLIYVYGIEVEALVHLIRNAVAIQRIVYGDG